MSSAWLHDFFHVQFNNESSATSDILDNDFRKSGQVFFYYIALICSFSNNAIESGQSLFFSEEFASARALPRK
jgi:hypothetical protein